MSGNVGRVAVEWQSCGGQVAVVANAVANAVARAAVKVEMAVVRAVAVEWQWHGGGN